MILCDPRRENGKYVLLERIIMVINFLTGNLACDMDGWMGSFFSECKRNKAELLETKNGLSN